MAIDASSLGGVTTEDLREWAAITAAPSVSIFFPTERAIAEPGNNSLKLRALVGRAREWLQEREHRNPDIDRLLGPLEELVDDRDFWFHQGSGLALLRTPDRFAAYKSPLALEEHAYVGDSPVIRPLIAAVTSLGEFYVLALSQNKIRLLHCTTHDWEELDLSGLDIPLNLEEALRWDDLQKPELQHHVGTGPGAPHRSSPAGAARSDMVFHGHGAGAEDEKVQILRYLQMVDRGVHDILKGKRVPVVLAGVEYLHAIYREASHYDFILAKGVDGNADELRPAEIHEKAKPLFEARLQQGFAAMAERYGDRASHGGSSNDLADILQAAEQGRIDSLFIAQDRRVWGTLDFTNADLKVSGEEPASNSDVELLDAVARRTILASGSAYLLPEDKVPGGGEIAAIYRY